ncbi:MAG: WD40 repeat domain-containing protein, partial [Candidatus Desantisbacteria bacterium]
VDDDGGIDFYNVDGKIIKQATYTDYVDTFASCMGKFSDNGEYFVLIGDNGTLWDKTFLVLYDKDGNELWKVIEEYPGWSYGQCNISKEGNYIIGAKTNTNWTNWINMFSKKGKLLWEYNAVQAGNFISLFSQDEKFILIGSAPNKLFLFKSNDGKLLWEFTDETLKIGFISINISSDNKYILAIAEEGKIYLLDMRGNLLWQKQYEKGAVANFTSDGKEVNIMTDNKLCRYAIQEGR